MSVPLPVLVVVTVLMIVEVVPLGSDPVTAPADEPDGPPLGEAEVEGVGVTILVDVSVSGHTVVECGMMEVMVEAGQLETELGQA